VYVSPLIADLNRNKDLLVDSIEMQSTSRILVLLMSMSLEIYAILNVERIQIPLSTGFRIFINYHWVK
jgi:hypothetical protein